MQQQEEECQYFYIKNGVEFVTPSLEHAIEKCTTNIIKVKYGNNTTAEIKLKN